MSSFKLYSSLSFHYLLLDIARLNFLNKSLTKLQRNVSTAGTHSEFKTWNIKTLHLQYEEVLIFLNPKKTQQLQKGLSKYLYTLPFSNLTIVGLVGLQYRATVMAHIGKGIEKHSSTKWTKLSWMKRTCHFSSWRNFNWVVLVTLIQ